MAVFFYEGLAGRYGLEETGGALTHLWLEGKEKAGAGRNVAAWMPDAVNGDLEETPLLREAKAQLDAYFAGRLKDFSLPLAPAGTAFQKKIWGLLQEIPYGTTRTYGEIAVSAGDAKACRAVGMANNRNPLPILIPCHRVVGANGNLVGYGGGLDIKLKLLQLEGIWLL